jgi:hypothetical protein
MVAIINVHRWKWNWIQQFETLLIMPRKLMKILSYFSIRRGTNTDFAQSKNTEITTPGNTSSAYRIEIFDRFDQTPLSRIIDVICDDDLTALIINNENRASARQNGMTPELLSRLQHVWLEMYSQFIELSDGIDNTYIKQLVGKINIFRARLLKVHLRVKYLSVQWDENYVNDLRAMNFRYEFNPANPKHYLRDLKLIISRCKQWELDIELWEMELNAYEKKCAGEKPSRIYFSESLMRLAKWFGGGLINPETITGLQYSLMRRDYHEYCNAVKRANEKKR